MLTEAGGADVILDNMGAKYLGRNVTALATGGRLVIIGMQGGTKGELDINALLRKRASVTATSLRARPLAEKAAICCGGRRERLAAGRLRRDPPDRRGDDAARGRRAARTGLMEDGGHAGKFVLTL